MSLGRQAPFLGGESIFIGQATLNGTRPIHPKVSSRLRPLSGGSLLYGSIPCMDPTPEDLSVNGLGRWPSVSLAKEIVG